MLARHKGHAQPRRRPWEPLRQLSDRTPLRIKLITAMLALVIMALAAISVASVVVLRSYLTTQQDGTLPIVFGNIAQAPAAAFGPAPPGFAYQVKGYPGVYAGIEVGGNQLSPVNSGLGGMGNGPQGPALPEIPTSQSWASANAGKLLTVGAQSGPDDWRVIEEPITYNGAPATLVVAYDLGNVNGVIRRLITIDLIVGSAIVIVLAIVGIAVVRANLRPLDDIEMTAGEIARGHLDHRIPERDPRTEVGSLGRSLNIMLSQIETAFHAQHESEQAAHASEERMRRFIADASHELRTPLTTIRGFAEYYRQRGGVRKDPNPSSITNGGASASPNGHSPGGLAPEDLDRIMQRLESEASRMGLLVEDLLQLARLDQQRPLDMAPVDLLTLAADAVQDARMVAPDRPVELVAAPGSRGRAGEQAPPHSSPVPAVVLDVEDDGPGMTTEQAQRVFERFYRADQARNRASGGTGLGLAIVDGLVAAHGGTVSVRTAPGQGADFQVRLPLSPDAQIDDLDEDAQPSDL